MSNVSDIYTLWLKPWHLPAGKPISVTIEKAETRTIHPRPTEERTALILSFAGKNRKLILNDGNANKMSDIGGEDWAAWQGLVIQLQRAKFTKDKETIYILPDTSPVTPGNTRRGAGPQGGTRPMGKGASLQPVVTTPELHHLPPVVHGGEPVEACPEVPRRGPIAEDEALTTHPTTNGNTEKPYRFPSTAAEKFYNRVQQATDNYYEDGAALQKALGGWFNFANHELWNERLSYACDMARQPA